MVVVEVNNEAVVGSYSSKELVEVGEVVNLVAEEVGISHNMKVLGLVKAVEGMVEVVMDK